MNVTNTELRLNVRNKMSGNYGQVFVAVFVPGLLGAAANFIMGMIVGGVPYLSDLVSLTISSIASFMSIKMVLNLARNHRNAGFDTSLSPAKSLGTFILYSLVWGLVVTITQIPVDLYFFDTVYVTAETLNEFLAPLETSTDPNALFEMLGILYGYIGVIFLLSIALSFALIKLYFVTYIIADDDLSFMDSIKKSWMITKGNILRIIGMNLSFFGWYILGLFTFGLLYLWVIPYHQMSLTNLFLYLKEQNGEEIQTFERAEQHFGQAPTTDWMEEEKPENDWDF